MMKGLRIIMFIFPVLWTNLQSQQLSHQVLVPLAGLANGTNISYSQTVGETAVEVTGCSFYIFTQGFQQPDIKFSDEKKPEGTNVEVYPNPVHDFLTIEMYGDVARTYIIEYINMAGRVIRSEKKEFCSIYWDKEPQYVKDLVSGLYMIRIRSIDGLFNRTFRIEKL
jgi:hypothetical protein